MTNAQKQQLLTARSRATEAYFAAFEAHGEAKATLFRRKAMLAEAHTAMEIIEHQIRKADGHDF